LSILIPFTPLEGACHVIDKHCSDILDVGCGKGVPMSVIRRRTKLYAVGADIFLPYLEYCKTKEFHNDYVLCDIRNLPFQRKSFDLVLCLEVIEHLSKTDGENLLRALEEIARVQVIISTPVGKLEQHPYDDNPFQEHKYGWKPEDLEKLGYQIKRFGFLVESKGERPLTKFFNIKAFKPLQLIAWPVAGLLIHFVPSRASGIVAYKKLH